MGLTAGSIRSTDAVNMVNVAEWLRRRIVVPVYVGSNPTVYPIRFYPFNYGRNLPSSSEVIPDKGMKPTAPIISVGLLVNLVLSRVSANVDIIHKPPEKRLANRRVKPCKESSDSKGSAIYVQSLVLGDKMLRTAVVSQSQRCNKRLNCPLGSHLTGFLYFLVYLTCNISKRC